MTLLLDPLSPAFTLWRLQQSVVLDIFLNSWFALSPEQRRMIPLQIDVDTTPKRIVDQTGKVVCEFGIHNGNTVFYWVRSWSDYNELDSWGQRIKEGIQRAAQTS